MKVALQLDFSVSRQGTATASPPRFRQLTPDSIIGRLACGSSTLRVDRVFLLDSALNIDGTSPQERHDSLSSCRSLIDEQRQFKIKTRQTVRRRTKGRERRKRNDSFAFTSPIRS